MKKNIVFLCGVLLLIGCAQGAFEEILVEQNKSAEKAVDGGDAGIGGDAGADTDTETETEVEEFWYLLCNTTGWNLSRDSRLQDTANPNVKAVTFDVPYSWMVTGFDTCAIARTEAENQWGPGLEFYSVSPNPMVVPAIANTFPGFTQFNVKYPALGTFEALLDIEAGTLIINTDSQFPTCTDGILNGDETDVDCGGPSCKSCKEGQSCRIDNDCGGNTCVDEKCVALSSDCDADSATDLESIGNNVTVPSNGCIKVESGYPEWWGTSRTMNLMILAGEDFPITFTWENCNGAGDVEEFTHNWQSVYLKDISAECPTVINLQGSGTEDVTLTYYGL